MIRHFLFLLSLLIWPAFFSANPTNGGHHSLPIFTEAESVCPAPAPDWLIATNITPTSISLLWGSTWAGVYYRVEGYDLTTSTPLPTYYTTNNFITYSGLTPGHTYKFDVSGSFCPDGPWGESRSTEVTTIIVIDIVIQVQNPCTPNITKPTGANISYNFCVSQSSNQNPPYTNGFIGQINYASSTCQFGVALAGNEMHIGKISGSSSFTFNIVNDNGVHEVVCKYASTTLFTIGNLNAPNTINQVNFSITFEGDYGNFRFCTNCSVGERSDDSERVEKTSIPPAGLLAAAPMPNPFNESVSFQYELTESTPVEINLHDATGRLVQVVEKSAAREPGQYSATVDGAGLPDGVYFLSVMTGQRIVYKIVKQE